MFNTEDEMKCKNEGCDSTCKLARHISFVDCPGHDLLMATMIAGASVMDCALLLVAANESCPQPQTQEHLASIEIIRLEHIIVLQNKIDIVMRDGTATQQYEQIKEFVKGTKAEKSPIIPISAQLEYNIDVLCDYICRVPIPIRDFTCPPRMSIVRSFDINLPGIGPDKLQGGVVGGSLLQGVLRVGEKIEIRPGMTGKDKNTGKKRSTSISSRIVSLKAEKNDLLYAVPGGLIAVGLKCDPSLTRDDHLSGHLLGHPGQLPEVLEEVVIKFYLLRRLLGVRSDSSRKEKVSSLKKEEILLINISANSIAGRVIEKKKTIAKIQFLTPACASVGDKITLSRKIDKNFRLIGWGEIEQIKKAS
jgi:translation initiation factor 2 subunit 3